MLATLIIFLREGVEASMIVAILLAYLNRIGQRQLFRDVLLGVGAALLLAAVGGVVAYTTITSYDGSRVQTIFETATYALAATVLTYMTFWMQRHARGLSAELRTRADAAIAGRPSAMAGQPVTAVAAQPGAAVAEQQGFARGRPATAVAEKPGPAVGRRARWGMGLLAFQAVGREGLETVVFTLAIVFSTSPASALSGAVIGLAGALVIAFVIYRLGHRLNLSRFFTVIGVLLMAFVAGLIANTVQNLQELGWLPVLTRPLWQSGRLLSEDSAFGDVLHSFFGYSDAPTPLQVIAYVCYLTVVIILFLRLRPGRPGKPGGSRPGPPRPATTG